MTLLEIHSHHYPTGGGIYFELNILLPKVLFSIKEIWHSIIFLNHYITQSNVISCGGNYAHQFQIVKISLIPRLYTWALLVKYYTLVFRPWLSIHDSSMIHGFAMMKINS